MTVISHKLIDKVFAFTQEKCLLSSPCHVLLGLSGGADSMALLHMLTHWPTDNIVVSAVHVHHGLRGEEADNDVVFVRNFCAQNNIPLSVIHGDVAQIAHEKGVSVEEAGRMLRYDAFERVRSELNADYILTAHTASDQTETVLMHILRGCSVDGLVGIPASRGCIRRPLLTCKRSEIEAYCSEYDVPFVVDRTNEDTRFARNDVRHRVLPVLREFNPSVDDALLRLSDSARIDSNFLSDMACCALDEAMDGDGYFIDRFIQQPASIRRRMIRQLFLRSCVSVYEESHITSAEQAILSRQGRVSLPGCAQFVVRQGKAFVLPEKSEHIKCVYDVVVMPCSLEYGRYALRVFVANNVNKLFANSIIDYDKIVGKLCVRSRATEDYMHPEKRAIGKSLKKLMNEWRIPSHLRDDYPLLCDDLGVVLVPGYACDERVKITEDTKHYLVCQIDDVQG